MKYYAVFVHRGRSPWQFEACFLSNKEALDYVKNIKETYAIVGMTLDQIANSHAQLS